MCNATLPKAKQCSSWSDLLSAADVSSNMGDSLAGLRGAGSTKFDRLPPHGVHLGAAILQRDDPAEHDVHPSQHLQTD